MFQSFAALFAAGLVVLACYAAGAVIIGLLDLSRRMRRMEFVPLAFLTGASALHLIYFGLFAVHLAYWQVLTAVLIAAIGWCWWRGPSLPARVPRSVSLVGATALLLSVPFLLLYLLT